MNIDPEIMLNVWLDALVESVQNGETDLKEQYLSIKRVVAWREQKAIEHWVKAQKTSPLRKNLSFSDDIYDSVKNLAVPPPKDLQRIFATGPGQYMPLQEVNTEQNYTNQQFIYNETAKAFRTATPTVRAIKSTDEIKPGEVWVKVSGNGLFALSLDQGTNLGLDDPEAKTKA